MIHNIKDYQQKLLADLGFAKASDQDRQKALGIIASRFQKVIIYTLLEHLTDEQKRRFSAALADKQTVEDKVAEIAAEVPGLERAIEQALLVEYEALKSGMQA